MDRLRTTTRGLVALLLLLAALPEQVLADDEVAASS
jgi:hypothetical protein